MCDYLKIRVKDKINHIVQLLFRGTRISFTGSREKELKPEFAVGFLRQKIDFYKLTLWNRTFQS
jgi:hypothetical protein